MLVAEGGRPRIDDVLYGIAIAADGLRKALVDALRAIESAAHHGQSRPCRSPARRPCREPRIAARSPSSTPTASRCCRSATSRRRCSRARRSRRSRRLPLVESGAADAYGFGDKELALACASHSRRAGACRACGRRCSPKRRSTAARWNAARTGRSNQDATVALARSGQTPSALHNNCSGKHSGFLCACRHLRIDHRGYVGADHPYQEMIREAMDEVTGAEHGARQSRHRRLLDPDLRGAAQKPRDGLCQDGDRRTAFRPIARARRSACSPPAWPSRSMSPVPAAPTSV